MAKKKQALPLTRLVGGNRKGLQNGFDPVDDSGVVFFGSKTGAERQIAGTASGADPLEDSKVAAIRGMIARPLVPGAALDAEPLEGGQVAGGGGGFTRMFR